MKKKKILFIVQLPPPTHGAAIMNKGLVESQVIKNKFEIQVLPLQFASSLEQLGRFTLSKVFKLIGYLFRLIKLLFFKHYDLAYYNLCPVGNTFYKDLIFVCILKLFRKEIVYHLHVKGITMELRNRAWKKYLYTFAFRNANIICLSKKLSAEVSNFSNKVFIVNNGISDTIPENIYLKKNCIPRILFLSNFIRSKGIMIFLESLRILNDKKVPFEAALVGNSADVTFSEVQDFILQYHMKDKVILLGARYQNEKMLEFQRADVFVFPTHYPSEAFPLVILEAMQFGLPVISTFEGAIPEIVEEGRTGLLIKPNDVADLASKIQILLENTELRVSMGEEGKKKFQKTYTLEIFENTISSVFDQIMK